MAQKWHPFVLIAYLLSNVALGNCDEAWSLLSTAKKTAYVAGQIVWQPIKAATYVPIVLPSKLAYHAVKVNRGKERPSDVIPTIAKSDWHSMLGYLFLKALHSSSGLTYNQWENQTEEFNVETSSDVRVIVDLTPPDEEDVPETRGAVKRIYQAKLASGQKVYYIKAVDLADAMGAMERLAKDKGLITHADIYFHGSAGRFWFGDNSYLSFKDHKFYELKPGDIDGHAARPSNSPLIGHHLSELSTGTFMAENAKIRWTGCLVGMSKEGRDTMHALSSKFLGTRGGEYYTNNVATLGNPVELVTNLTGAPTPPKLLRQYGDLLSPLYAIPMVNNNYQHKYVKYPDLENRGPIFWRFDHVDHIKIAPTE